MRILSKLKGVLGIGRSGREVGGTDVPVEREPATETERAVEGSSPPSAPTSEPGVSEPREPDVTEPPEPDLRDPPDPDLAEALEPDLTGTPESEATEPAMDEPPARPDADLGSAEPVDSLDGIGPAYAERLGEAGVQTVADLAAADAADLADRTGLSEGRIAGWIDQARSS